MMEEYYRNKRTKTRYRTFHQFSHARQLSQVTTYKNPKDKYIVNTENIELVINHRGRETILTWDKDADWTHK